MPTNIKTLIGSAITALGGLGVQLSGYTNLPLAIALWTIAGILFLWWLWHSLPERPLQRKFMGPVILFGVCFVGMIVASVWYLLSVEQKSEVTLVIRPQSYDVQVQFDDASISAKQKPENPFLLTIRNLGEKDIVNLTVKFELRGVDLPGVIQASHLVEIIEPDERGAYWITTKLRPDGSQRGRFESRTSGERKIDLVPARDQNAVQLEMPTPIIGTLTALMVLKSGLPSGPSPELLAALKDKGRGHIALENDAFQRMIEMPDISVVALWADQTLTVTLKSIYVPLFIPLWATRAETGEKLLTRAGGILSFENPNEPELGHYNRWNDWKKANVQR